MTDDFDSLVRWPLRTDEWPRTVLVGALLVATAPLVLPSVLLAGYAVRLLRTDFDDGSLPAFDDPRSLVGTGTRAAGVVVAYHLPAAVLLTAGVGAASASLRWRAPATLRPAAVVASLTSGPLSGALALAGAVVLPVCGYLATVGLTAYATTDDVAEAFAVGRIRRRALSIATLRAWLLGSLVTVVTGVCAIVLAAATTAIPGVGHLLAGAVRFYGGVVALVVWSETLPVEGTENRNESGMQTTEPGAEPT
ncbi:DUF4013 domain-containing protein [Haloplanus salilacus]|uniref:DUF4013 domain-containing protein n=1 Tax=Haloplanus salilacus TaxID=2949994 RepID=UPI0030D29AA1